MSQTPTTAAHAAGELATFTVFSASSGKVYACAVAIDVAAGWTQPYGGRPDELLALELFDSWRSFPDTRGIAVMRVS